MPIKTKTIAGAVAILSLSLYGFAQETYTLSNTTLDSGVANQRMWNSDGIYSTPASPAATGPGAGDTLSFDFAEDANNLNRYLRILETDNKIGGIVIDKNTNYTREIAKITGYNNKNNTSLYLSAGTAGFNSDIAFSLKVGEIALNKFVVAFTNSSDAADTTKMNVEVGNISTSTSNPGAIRFGNKDANLAINSVTITGTIKFNATKSNVSSVNFLNVTEDVKILGTVTKAANAVAAWNAANFTGIGGDIYFTAQDNGIQFMTLGMATLGTDSSAPKNSIIFEGIADFYTQLLASNSAPVTIMSWMALSSNNANVILAAMKKGNAAYADYFSLAADNMSIMFSTTPIPEPATYAAIFGALALAFAAYRRKRA